MTDAELSARMRDNIVAFKRLQATQGTVRHLRLPGVHAFALPVHPSVTYQQAVLYESTGALADALRALEAFFRELAVPAWRVSVPTVDAEAQRLLGRAGYHPGEVIPVLGRRLEEVPAARSPVTLERPSTLGSLLTLYLESFGERAVHLEAWSGRRVPAPLHPLVASEAGQALSGGVALDEGDTTGIYLLATSKAARRRGLASEVLHGLEREARARGFATVVLQSTPMAHELYLRLGFREVDRWTDWVRRVG